MVCTASISTRGSSGNGTVVNIDDGGRIVGISITMPQTSYFLER
ncbi:hypothetical protein [Acinetobacter sp. MB5]|nr:hypothetical protein [Acinetobacter sp. MB5]